MKICPLGTEAFHAGGRMDGRTDTEVTTKPTAAFLHFANAPYKLVEQREYNV
jgi:hypothetical protein